MADQPDTLTITLRQPIKFAGVDYEKIELREPRAGEMAKASNTSNGIEMSITLISLVAKIPRGAVEQLCARDLEEASNYLGGFTVGGQAIGLT